MNYELFYKMIKEGQTDTPSLPKAPAAPTAPTDTPANSQPAPPTPPQPTSGTSNDNYTPGQVRSEDAWSMVKNTPVSGMKPVPTAEQLANRWIQEKEDFYHNKADRYPQYANWHVSNQTRDHLMQQAQDMVKNHKEEAARIWAQQKYNSALPISVYRDEAFQYANRGNKDYVDKRNGKIQKADAGQNDPMQNPVAPAALGNQTNQGVISGQSASSASPAPLSLQDKVKRGQEIMAQLYRANGYHPDSLSPQRRDMRNVLNQMLSQYFPQNGVMSPLAQYYQYCSLLGIQPFGSEQNNINRLQDAYTDSQHFQEYTPGPGYTGAWQNSLNAPDWNKGYTYY